MSAVTKTKLNVSMTYKGPKSVCACGHAGDGQGVARDAAGGHAVPLHAGTIGHGACMYAKCRCIKFTWARHTDHFTRAIASAR